MRPENSCGDSGIGKDGKPKSTFQAGAEIRAKVTVLAEGVRGSMTKALTKFAKDVPAVRFKGAMLDGQVVPPEQIQAIANLPSRDELIAKLLFVLQSPIRGLATVLQANIRNLAVVLDQIGKQRSTTA